jgi:hypothetical protein
MEPVALAGGEERRDGLVGVVRIAPRIGAAILEDVGRGANGLMMKQPVAQAAAPGDRGLGHEHAPARPQHPRRLAEEDDWKFEMMQHIAHAAVVRELIGCRAFHHIALMRMNANNTMRSSMKPSRKREIWVSP